MLLEKLVRRQSLADAKNTEQGIGTDLASLDGNTGEQSLLVIFATHSFLESITNFKADIDCRT
jgi:hypothetical protein